MIVSEFLMWIQCFQEWTTYWHWGCYVKAAVENSRWRTSNRKHNSIGNKVCRHNRIGIPKINNMFSRTGNSVALEKMSLYVSGIQKFKMADIKPEVHVSILLASSRTLIYITCGCRLQLIWNIIAICDIEFPALDNIIFRSWDLLLKTYQFCYGVRHLRFPKSAYEEQRCHW